MSGARTVVVGGGVGGVCCAYALAREGLDVVLLERGEVASGASRGNAGTVSAGHPPLNRPGRIRQAVFQMLDPKSPLYVPPRWDPELWRWLLSFARHCTDAHVERCMSVMAPLGIEALEIFDRLIEEEHIDCGYRSEGYFEVCTTEKGIARARHEASIIGRSGYHPEVVDAHELRRREPEFGDEVVGGVHYPEARTLDPYRFVTAGMELARDRGVELRERVSVASVATDGGRVAGVRTEHGDFVGADHVVLATGPLSLELARRLGVRLPVQPGKGYHRDVAVGPAGAPPLRTACGLNETSVFCTPMDGFVRFAVFGTQPGDAARPAAAAHRRCTHMLAPPRRRGADLRMVRAASHVRRWASDRRAFGRYRRTQYCHGSRDAGAHARSRDGTDHREAGDGGG